MLKPMKHKRRRNITRRVTAFFLVLAIVFAFPAQAAASSGTEMRIHAIWHGNGAGRADFNGESVLIESRGSFLLMDIPMWRATRDHVIPYLLRIADRLPGRTITICIYVSHFHPDHYGGGNPSGQASGMHQLFNHPRITVNNVYLPDIADVRWTVNSAGQRVPHRRQVEREERVTRWVRQNPNVLNNEPVPLRVGSRIRIGDARLEVIGPVGRHLQNFRALMAESRRLGLTLAPRGVSYLNENAVLTNNYSLVSRVTAGNIRFLTAGDIEGRSYRIPNAMDREEDALIRRHGRRGLRADILKLSRHGAHPSNTARFLRYVNPTYTFLTNNHHNHRNIQSTWERASARSVPYMVGSERRTLIFCIRNNNIRLFRSNRAQTNADTRLRGLTTLRGFESGTRSRTYYIRSNGRPFTGFRNVRGIGRVYFTPGGAMARGWRTIDGRRRHFARNGEMSTGVQRIGGQIYWFDRRGRMQTNRTSGNLRFGANGVLENPPNIRRVNRNSLTRSGRRTVTVRWDAVPNVSGYEIQFADNARFRRRSSVIVRGGDSQRARVPNRNNGAAHIRIRPFVTVGSSRLYGRFRRVP